MAQRDTEFRLRTGRAGEYNGRIYTATYTATDASCNTRTEAGFVIDLGVVTCVEEASTDASTAGFEDSDTPAPGEAFFYVVEYFDGTGSSYGTESASKPRAPAQGACQ